MSLLQKEIKAELKRELLFSKYGTKLFPNFINPNNGYFKITGKNILRTSSNNNWYGIKADVILSDLGRYHFSVKLEAFYSMIGYAVSTADPSSGYYTKN